MMIFGISTICLSHLSVIQTLQKIAQNGFLAAEVWYEHVLRTGDTAAAIKDAALDLGLQLSIHGPLYDINPTSLNKGIRKESYRQIACAVEFASRINADTVVIHPGRLSSSKASLNEYWEMMFEFCFFLDRIASLHNVWIGLEGMEKKRYEVFVEPDAISRIMHSPWNRIKLTMDCAHIFSFSNLINFIAAVPFDWIHHVHLSDYSPACIHNPLGKGNTNIPEVLEILSFFYDGNIIIEEVYSPDDTGVLEHCSTQLNPDCTNILRCTYHYLNRSGWMNSSSHISFKKIKNIFYHKPVE